MIIIMEYRFPGQRLNGHWIFSFFTNKCEIEKPFGIVSFQLIIKIVIYLNNNASQYKYFLWCICYDSYMRLRSW